MSEKLVPIKVHSAALDEIQGGTTGIILRGVVTDESLQHRRVDDYQREAQPLTSQWRILDALQKGEPLPDIELGMRGQSFRTEKDGSFTLLDPIFIVDGLQRVTTAIHYLGTVPVAIARLGATVHFDTNKEWERDRFHVLNTQRLKVSPNVILRNMREKSQAILTLYGLSTNEKAFPLHQRVSWVQRMTKGEMVTALTFAKVAGYLHSHKVGARSTTVDQLVPSLDRVVEAFGVQAFRENMRSYFSLIDDCWGIRRVQYKEGAIYMRGQFLFVLSRLLSDHTDFWRQPDDKRLFVEADLKRKIAQFPIHDPEIVRLSGSSGKAREMLYIFLRDHINSGRRTRRLTPRTSEASNSFDEEADEEPAAA